MDFCSEVNVFFKKRRSLRYLSLKTLKIKTHHEHKNLINSRLN